MFRAGLLRLIHPQTGCAGSSAGAFAVAKDKDKDEEVMAGPVRLPYAPRLRRVILAKGKALWIGKRDLSNCFYLFKVNDGRLPRQVIGPR
eukprot:1139097-Amphidinium_carterae.1